MVAVVLDYLDKHPQAREYWGNWFFSLMLNMWILTGIIASIVITPTNVMYF